MKKDINMNNFKYKELKKAILDGAIAEAFIATREDGEVFHYEVIFDRTWKPLLSNGVLTGAYDNEKLRIKPDCKYAMKQIKEAGGDHAVNLYTHWLGGGTLVDYDDSDAIHSIKQEPTPYETFMNMISEEWKLTKKKETKKQVFWIFDQHLSNIPKGGNKVHGDWFDEGIDPNFLGINFKWHKVPSITQEVDI